MNLATELERLADALESEAGGQPQVSFVSLAERIAMVLSVRTDEVAILGVSHRWRHLHFVVPEALKNVGFIPLSSKTALAARTTRESRPEIINDFTNVRHATVFEGVLRRSRRWRDSNQPQRRQRENGRPRFHLRRPRKSPFALQAPRKAPSARHRRIRRSFVTTL